MDITRYLPVAIELRKESSRWQVLVILNTLLLLTHNRQLDFDPQVRTFKHITEDTKKSQFAC